MMFAMSSPSRSQYCSFHYPFHFRSFCFLFAWLHVCRIHFAFLSGVFRIVFLKLMFGIHLNVSLYRRHKDTGRCRRLGIKV